MSNEHPQSYEFDLSTRVTRMESAVETLAGTMNDVSVSIKHIERSLTNVGRTDTKTLVTIGSSLAGVVITIWFILVAPINLQLTTLKDGFEKLDVAVRSRATVLGDVARLESTTSRLSERIDAMERREAAATEHAKFVEELVMDLAAVRGQVRRELPSRGRQ